MKINFIGPAYTSRSANYASSRSVNLYLEKGKGKEPGLLIGSPGLTAAKFTLTGTSGVRGCYGIDQSTSIWVCGGTVYKVTSAFAATSIGSVPDDGASVTIAWNGLNLLVVSAGDMWSFTLAGTVGTFIRSGIAAVDSIDDYFIAIENDSGNFIWSDVLTTTFDPLSIQATNGANDILIGLKVARRSIYFLGSKSLEQWYPSTTNVDLPFTRIDGAFFELGCIAKNSVAELDTVFWLSGDDNGAGSVWTVSGGSPRRVTTPAIEFAIAQWPDLTDAEAFTYVQEGHSFYVISSTSAQETWAYDITVDEWHQRAYLHASGELRRIRPRCHLYFAGFNLVGDYENGNVYAYDLDTYSDNGNPLPAIRACETIQDELKTINVGTLQLDMDTGVGISTGQGVNPQAMLRWSRDGGKTWSNSIWATIGRIGEYGKRCIWRRVGGGDRIVFEVTITDPVRRCITGAYFK